MNDMATQEVEHLEHECEMNDVYLPSREEIDRACAEIRSEWTPKERRKRRRWAGTDVPDWVVPEYAVSWRDVA